MALARKLLGNCQRLVLVYKYQILESRIYWKIHILEKEAFQSHQSKCKQKKFSQGHLMLGASSFQQATQQGQGPK
jgi:hypothetical protein